MGSALSFGRKRADSDADAVDDEVDGSKDLLKVSPWDAGSMKRTLDEKTPEVRTRTRDGQ